MTFRFVSFTFSGSWAADPHRVCASPASVRCVAEQPRPMDAFLILIFSAQAKGAKGDSYHVARCGATREKKLTSYPYSTLVIFVRNARAMTGAAVDSRPVGSRLHAPGGCAIESGSRTPVAGPRRDQFVITRPMNPYCTSTWGN